MTTATSIMLQDTILFLHVAGGCVAIVAGYAALAARKGAGTHRAAGNVFMASMTVMGVFAGVLGLPFGGAFTCYLVVTAWATVRTPAGAVGGLDVAGVVMAAAIILVALGGAAVSAAGAALPGEGPTGAAYGVAGLAAVCGALDLRMIRRGGIAGFERIRRHLWRMCAAMFVATGSFFLGQTDEIPRALHGSHLWLLALAPLGALVFGIIRTRPRRPRLRAAPAAP